VHACPHPHGTNPLQVSCAGGMRASKHKCQIHRQALGYSGDKDAQMRAGRGWSGSRQGADGGRVPHRRAVCAPAKGLP
jgi:hypothetical protein